MRPARVKVLRRARVLALGYCVYYRSALLVRGFARGFIFFGKETETVLSRINPAPHIEQAGLVIVGNKAAVFFIERAYPVIALYGVSVHCVLRAVKKNIFRLRTVFCGYWKHYNTFPVRALFGIEIVITFVQIASRLPFAHVGRGVYVCRTASARYRGGNHHIINAVVVPHEGVAELVSLTLRIVRRLGNYYFLLDYPVYKIGVVGVGRVRESNVLSAPRSCVGARRYSKPRRTVGTYARAARPYSLWTYACRGNYRVFYVFPVNHIVADDMRPAYLRPVRSGRIVLIEYVVFTLVIERGVRFVHPYCGGNTVILRAVSVALVNRAVKRYVLPVKLRVRAIRVRIGVHFPYLFGRKRSAVNFNLVQQSAYKLPAYAEFLYGVCKPPYI